MLLSFLTEDADLLLPISQTSDSLQAPWPDTADTPAWKGQVSRASQPEAF